jgi:hemolysin activation/secretion protein
MTASGWKTAVQCAVTVLAVLAGRGEAYSQQAPIPSSGSDSVTVSLFRVTGATVFPPEKLHELLAEGEGRALTLAQIEGLAARITAFYRERGYILGRAYVPAQEMRGGVVEIAVLEGHVGRIEVNGVRWYDPDYIRSYVQLAPESRAFELGRFERGMLLLNELPGLEVKSALQPGVEPGTTDVVLDVEKDRLVTGSVEADNYGSKATAYERFGVALNLNNPLGIGDGLAFRGLTSREGGALWLARLAYTVPINTLGTKVGAAYTHVAVGTDVGSAIGLVDIHGAGDMGSLYALHPFVRGRALSIYGVASFDYKDFKNEFTSNQLQVVQKDRLRVFTMGGSLNSIDAWRGANSLSLNLQQGVGGFLGGLKGDNDSHASRLGAGGTFTKLTGEVARLQQITDTTSIFFKATGQWASTGLVATEQFIVGGQGTVRGYPVAEISGDNGYAVTGEFRWNAPGFADVPAFLGKKWGEILQFFIFIDHGRATLLDPQPGERRNRWLTGAGIGVQMGIAQNSFLKLEFAKPVIKPIDGRPPSDGLDNRVYFLAAKWF